MFENFWFYFSKLDIPESHHVVFFAEDESATVKLKEFLQMKKLPSSQFILTSGYDNLANAQNGETSFFGFKTEEFGKLVSKRPAHILHTLSLGYKAVLYTDADIAWLRNPLPFLSEMAKSGGYDVLAPSDGVRNGNTYYCTGFMYFLNSKGSIEILKEWGDVALKGKATLKSQTDQDFYRTALYSHGPDYFKHGKLLSNRFANGVSIHRGDTRQNLKDGELYIFHANFVEGFQGKKKDLLRQHMWWKPDSA